VINSGSGSRTDLPVGAHQGHGDNEAGQFVDGHQRLFHRLPPLKLRRPFFDKGGYALASIISRDNPSKFGLLDGQPVVDRGVETAMNRGQRRTDRERRFGRKHFRQGQRFRKQTRSRRDSVDQSEAGCFFRIKNPPRKDEFDGRFAAAVPRQASSPTEGWNNPDVNLGLAEGGDIRAYRQMGGLHQPAAASVS